MRYVATFLCSIASRKHRERCSGLQQGMSIALPRRCTPACLNSQLCNPASGLLRNNGHSIKSPLNLILKSSSNAHQPLRFSHSYHRVHRPREAAPDNTDIISLSQGEKLTALKGVLQSSRTKQPTTVGLVTQPISLIALATAGNGNRRHLKNTGT